MREDFLSRLTIGLLFDERPVSVVISGVVGPFLVRVGGRSGGVCSPCSNLVLQLNGEKL